MMKKAIKLLVLAGALLSVGAMAQSQDTVDQDWHFKFPKYIFVYTNTTDVYFDLTDNSADGDASVLPGNLSDYKAASLANLENCILNQLGTNPDYDTTASPNALNKCKFAPSGITHSGYTVTWPSGKDSDGSLLVITNATYTVSVEIDSTITGADLMVAPKLTTDVQETDFATLNTNSQQIATDQDDLTTQYNGVYIIPLSFAAQIDPGLLETDSVLTVTYTAAVQ